MAVVSSISCAVEATSPSATSSGSPADQVAASRGGRPSSAAATTGEAAAAEVADLIAPILGWSPEHAAREVEHYRLRVQAERGSQEEADDLTADAARLGAPDVRFGARTGA